MVYSVSFSPDGTILASGTNKGTIELWDVATRQNIATLEGHGTKHSRVWSVSFSPDGTTLASDYSDGTIELWEVATRQNIATLEGHGTKHSRAGVWSMSFSPNGTTLASGTNKGTIELWDVVTQQNIATLEGHTEGVYSVSFSPDGTTLASGSRGIVRLWDVATQINFATFRHEYGPSSMSFSPDGTTLAIATGEGITLWDTSESGELVQQALAEIDIPDPNLRAAIATALGKQPSDSIRGMDLADLTKLWLWNTAVRDFTGLEFATNLRWLLFYGNSISDISALAKLTNLTDLSLSVNSISDISALAGLTNLAELSLAGNSISDISALAGLTNLTELSLSVNTISDISALAGLTNLAELWLYNNTISDISALAGLTNLAELWLYNNTISDISALAGLTDLTELWLDNNTISDISALAGLTNLTKLSLSVNTISDISALAGLTDLTELWLDNNTISDISALAGLTNLTKLSLSVNTISDISALAGLTNLTELWLDNNTISDISALAGLTNLTKLSLYNNTISDISPLVANTGLESEGFVNLRRNPLSYQSIHTHIPALQRRGVTVRFDNQAHPTLLKISGDNQKGVTDTPLENPFVVEVQDENGSALAGVSVTFTVVAGSGTLSVANTTTDANGRAESTLTMGLHPETSTVSVTASGIEGTVTFDAISSPFIEYLLSIPAGISLIHAPLKVTEVDGAAQPIESVGDLYDALGGASSVNYLITFNSSTQEWLSYFVPSDKGGPTDAPLIDDTGIIAGMKTPTLLRLRGDALGTDGSSTIALNQGLNLVGLPLRDSRVTDVSDLFALEGIRGNVSAIILTDGGEFKLVGPADDPGDIAITGGQSFILTAQQSATVAISGEGWTNGSGGAAGPPVVVTGIEVGEATPILGLKGSIVDEMTGVNRGGLRVTVKNLSTDRKVTTVAAQEEEDYRLTVVDIETVRAARIGDILDISAQSPHPFIGVEPVRYTVTTEDVKRSWIQLPALTAYEIPAETELLANYPNPFNPETWIPYRLAEDAFVTLTIYDLNGRVVRTLEIGHRIAAIYESRSKAIYWDGRNDMGERVASGVYFYHLSADRSGLSVPHRSDYSATRKMLIIK